MYATISDSWILGMGAAFLVLFCFSIKSHDYMERFLGICLMFWASSLVVRLALTAGAENTSVMSQRLLTLPLQNFITGKKVLFAEGIILCLGMVLIKIAKKKDIQIPYDKIRKVFVGVVVTVLSLAVTAVLVVNLSPEKQWEGGLQWMNLLKLQDNFGSSRGIIVDPYNELLQFMSMTGIFGAVCYFGFLISTAVSAAKQSRHYPVMMMGTVVICSYLAQSMVNNPTVFLTPTLFLYLGILKSLERHYKEKEC